VLLDKQLVTKQFLKSRNDINRCRKDKKKVACVRVFFSKIAKKKVKNNFPLFLN
jgi:hypothetical protein